MTDKIPDAAVEAWIVVKEHVWDHADGGRPTLAYLWPSEFERRVYPSFDTASAFIKEGNWPLGFVAMQIQVPPAPAVQGDELFDAVGRIFGCDGSPYRTRDVAVVLREYAALASLQPSPAGQGGALSVRTAYAIATSWREQASKLKVGRATLIRCAAELEAALAARQPVGQEPFGWWMQDANGVGYFTRTMQPAALFAYNSTPGYSATPLHAAPPAQAVDLEQFRYLAQWVKDGCNFLQCDPAKLDSSASELLRAINATESAK